ncbi:MULTISPECIES: hypothetical protein [Chryseobacterium]|uniref:Nucleoside-diphosphate-sugar epimerase n=1 Tax=Chryseobacterium camelliae TaxID=1265445 RepID=A0ABU0TM82_9FLAO|nr:MULTISPECIES: hypothetical protein [Chryseobacterium]MDT3408806.1 nucleoside-diphosphate-sugar epimerase [Pseudacidovorax intermedius]MDQ1097338.1 nucleoside-diphosphate-sugar epimerase [Chryseobacterium camelliae]MDQ1101270.1 nucleoside-diphosphate-sugar epimerase [Chryseobacterium sp. SORGH_AS_1048]MDR6084715.1 nucleoside-diphosphate-sugar epimerase [Chryseobacterium sp. SORGH_AS_0909]MDR6132988.1 nucleoside-diphosphate-sugar epimerase [Chryseobacterium sp. SORGH_AS_1175]
MSNIGIIGCGWLGSRIAEKLSDGHTLYCTTTSPDKVEGFNAKGYHPAIIDFDKEDKTQDQSVWNAPDSLEILIVTVTLSGKRMDDAILEKRFRNLSSFIGDFKGQLFFMSSTGVYPDLSEVFTEDDLQPEQVPGENMIRARYPKANVLRLGGLMGDSRLLSRYRISATELPVNHIHYADIAAVVEKMISLHSEGKLYNVVAPLHPSKAAVISAQQNGPDQELHEPKGRTISSSRLIEDLNYQFIFPDPRFFHV